MRKKVKSRIEKKKTWIGILFQIPAAAFILLTMVIPLIWNMVLAFFKWNGNGAMKFVGLDNFMTIFSKRVYYNAYFYTVKLAVISTAVGLILGVMLALMIYRMKKLEGAIYRFIIFAPCIIPMTVVGLIFSFMLSPEMGLVNNLLRALGLGSLTHAWLSEPQMVLGILGIIQGWRMSGTIMILFYTGILSIPKSLLEAATIDGCTYPRQVRSIILPIMKPTMQLSLSMLLLSGFKSYEIVTTMTKGGPAGRTRTVPLKMLEAGFTNNDFGLAAAVAVLLIIIVTIFLLAGRFATKGETYEF